MRASAKLEMGTRTLSSEHFLSPTAVLGLALIPCVVFSAVNFWWISHDSQPQGADQANHLIRSLEFTAGIRDLSFHRLWVAWKAESGVYTYPPLYHLVTGIFILLGSRPPVAGVFANTVFLILLTYSVLQIGRVAFNLAAGFVAAILTIMYPMMAQLYHEAFIDFALTGMTAWCVWCLIATEGFQKRGASIVCGLSIGLGFLVKQLIPLYLIGPAITCLWFYRQKVGRDTCKNVALSIASFLLISIPWYGLHWHAVLATGAFNQRVAAIEGDPMPWTVPGAVFYLNMMGSEQVGFPTFVLTIISAMLFSAKWFSMDCDTVLRRSAQAAVALWIIVSLLLLTFCILNKDIRYSMPILPAIALIAASPLYLIRSGKARGAFVLFLGSIALPYYTHSLFSWPRVHRDIGFNTGPIHWSIWKSNYYYGGSPSVEDWSLTDIIFRMWSERRTVSREHPIRLALVPFLLRLNLNSLRLESLQCDIPLEVYQVANDLEFFAEGRLMSHDFLLAKTGDLGLPFMTTQVSRVTEFISHHPDRFVVLQTYPFPDGSTGTLFKIIKEKTVG
jgi:hypothetical protein